jgi:hypothetical protein
VRHITEKLIFGIFLWYRVSETLPLYDILNEFQKGHSHMAVVVRRCNKAAEGHPGSPPESRNQFHI